MNAPEAIVEDACAFAWQRLIECQPERTERIFAWLRTVAIHEAWRMARRERVAGSLDEPSANADSGSAVLVPALVTLGVGLSLVLPTSVSVSLGQVGFGPGGHRLGALRRPPGSSGVRWASLCWRHPARGSRAPISTTPQASPAARSTIS